MNLKTFLKELIADPEDLEAFGLWAFGSELRKLDRHINFMERWNEIHGNGLKLNSFGEIAEDVPKMISLWLISRGMEKI